MSDNSQVSLNDLFGFDQSQLDAMANLGADLYEQGKTKEAAIVFEGLIALTDSYYGYAGMGAISLSQEKCDEAVAYLAKAIELNPGDPTVRANLGEALLKKGRFNEAAAEFEKSLNLDPNRKNPGTVRARAILQGMGAAGSEMDRLRGLVEGSQAAKV